MSHDTQLRADHANIFDAEFEADFESDSELDSPFAENVVTAAVAAFTVLVVSSVAVLMYLA